MGKIDTNAAIRLLWSYHVQRHRRQDTDHASLVHSRPRGPHLRCLRSQHFKFSMRPQPVIDTKSKSFRPRLTIRDKSPMYYPGLWRLVNMCPGEQSVRTTRRVTGEDLLTPYHNSTQEMRDHHPRYCIIQAPRSSLFCTDNHTVHTCGTHLQ